LRLRARRNGAAGKEYLPQSVVPTASQTLPPSGVSLSRYRDNFRNYFAGLSRMGIFDSRIAADKTQYLD
jgi:hypothetical protein